MLKKNFFLLYCFVLFNFFIYMRKVEKNNKIIIIIYKSWFKKKKKWQLYLFDKVLVKKLYFQYLPYLCLFQDTSAVISFCYELVRNKVNEYAFEIALEYSLSIDNSNLSFELFKYLKSKRQLKEHFFWPLFLSNRDPNLGEYLIINFICIVTF